MYDISDYLISNLKDWDTARDNLTDKRWEDVDNGYQEFIPAYASDFCLNFITNPASGAIIIQRHCHMRFFCHLTKVTEYGKIR